MIKAKTFIEAINNFHECSRKFKTYLNDNRLTQLEKSVLECFLLLSDSKFDEVLDELKDLAPSNDNVINSQRELILGIAYNNRGDSNLAITHLKRSLELMEGVPLPGRIFIAHYNLFFCYYNLKYIDGMKSTLELITPYEGMRTQEKILHLYCQLGYSSFAGKMTEAQHFINELKKFESEMNQNQKVVFLMDQFDFFIKNDNHTGCYEILDQMSRIKKYHSGAIFKFMKGLLNHLSLGTPLYLYESDFVRIPILQHQLKVLKSLEENHLTDAKVAWDKLRALSPVAYLPDFNYQGDKCLFSECLKRSLPLLQTMEEKFVPELSQAGSRGEMLIAILENSPGPIKKEEIYEKIYGHSLENKEDLKKLAQLIYKVRLSHKLEIQTRKGCYYIKKTA